MDEFEYVQSRTQEKPLFATNHRRYSTTAGQSKVLDLKNGFWQVPLDEASSYATTFGTPWRPI